MSRLFSHFFQNHNEIQPQGADFTEVLSTIAVKPEKLYFYGKLPEKHPKTVAIVGTRKPSKYGEKVAFELAYELAKRGVVVVSGLAYGIDAMAHRGALEAKGRTVAILGTPIDEIYPRENMGLAKKIIEMDGAVMSELAPGAKYMPKASFLERNRLISGVADVVVVVEAAERSGSLNTAAHALEQGREVFAVPGDITRPTSRGCNRLIAQGASVYTRPEDVLNLLFPKARKPKTVEILPVGQKQTIGMRAVKIEAVKGDSDEETMILVAIFDGAVSGEEIAQATGMRAEKVSQLLTLLEVKGRIEPLGMNKWALKL